MVVPAALDERRYFILGVARSRVGDREYFNELWRQMESGGYEAMLFDLLARDISKFKPRDAPVTSGLMEQKKLSMSTEKKWWLDCLHRGCALPDNMQLGEWTKWVSTSDLYDSYRVFAERRRERHVISREELGAFMGTVGAKSMRGTRLKKTVGGKAPTTATTPSAVTLPPGSEPAKPKPGYRPPGYHVGALDIARDEFTKKMKITVVWPEVKTINADGEDAVEDEPDTDEDAPGADDEGDSGAE
jgi:hypothetical protein